MNTPKPPWWIIKHVPFEGPGLLAEELSSRGHSYRIVELHRGDALPETSTDTIGGVIVLGGPMNVDETDRYPFLSEERVWIKDVLAAGIPIMGVCLGAQLMARSAGAPVVANEEKEIGFDAIELTDEGIRDPIFSGVPNRFDVFHWHGDRFELPAASTLLSRSAQCRHQALRLHPSAYGFQFHLEITEDMIDRWTSNAAEELKSARTSRETILADSREKLASVHAAARKIFSNYFDRIVPAV